jgi:hypothetical protein
MIVDIEDAFRGRGVRRIAKSYTVKKFRAIKDKEYLFRG